jgi:hypothetical protein
MYDVPFWKPTIYVTNNAYFTIFGFRAPVSLILLLVLLLRSLVLNPLALFGWPPNLVPQTGVDVDHIVALGSVVVLLYQRKFKLKQVVGRLRGSRRSVAPIPFLNLGSYNNLSGRSSQLHPILRQLQGPSLCSKFHVSDDEYKPSTLPF